MEVLYDLDYEARQLGSELGLEMVRAGTVGHHPAIIRMIAELIRERVFRSVYQEVPYSVAVLVEKVKGALAKHPAAYPEIVVTSSEKGEGIETLRALIATLA